MPWEFYAGVAAYGAAALIIWAWCSAAARGDRAIEDACNRTSEED